jgi:hypothetical protein
MPLLRTVRDADEGTAKDSLRMDDEWQPAVRMHPVDERVVSLVIEDIDNRFILDLYVKDRDATVKAFQTLFETLQELQIGE